MRSLYNVNGGGFGQQPQGNSYTNNANNGNSYGGGYGQPSQGGYNGGYNQQPQGGYGNGIGQQQPAPGHYGPGNTEGDRAFFGYGTVLQGNYVKMDRTDFSYNGRTTCYVLFPRQSLHRIKGNPVLAMSRTHAFWLQNRAFRSYREVTLPNGAEMILVRFTDQFYRPTEMRFTFEKEQGEGAPTFDELRRMAYNQANALLGGFTLGWGQAGHGQPVGGIPPIQPRHYQPDNSQQAAHGYGQQAPAQPVQQAPAALVQQVEGTTIQSMPGIPPAFEEVLPFSREDMQSAPEPESPFDKSPVAFAQLGDHPDLFPPMPAFEEVAEPFREGLAAFEADQQGKEAAEDDGHFPGCPF